jgi:integrase/recombinase XerD
MGGRSNLILPNTANFQFGSQQPHTIHPPRIPAHFPSLAAPEAGTGSASTRVPKLLRGRRDRTLILLAVQTGLRVSELIGLNCHDVALGTGAHVRCLGKGRKLRCTPLRPETTKMVGAWLRERHSQPEDPVFPSIRGGRLSRDAVEYLLTKYANLAARSCPSLKQKKVTPHVCRHAAAMDLLHHGVDRSVIALWLGHESPETTQMYLHADMRLKEKALSRTEPLGVKPTRYRPDDKLLAFLERL